MGFGEPIGVGEKDPDNVDSFTLDWSDYLNGLSLNGSSFATTSTSTGLTISGSTYSTTTTTVVVSGGTAGQTYKLLNRITVSTSTGAPALQQDRTIHIEVLEH